jgi:hypothetical protein
MRRFFCFESWQVEWAALASSTPRFGAKKNHSTEAQKAGIRYERRAQEYLMELYPDTYVASPWLVFRLQREPTMRWCQPDGFIVDVERGVLTIVEIKLRHMVEAYTQVTGIYHPVLKKIFPRFSFRHVEVTRWYDPATDFPVPVQLLSGIDLASSSRFGVHVWKP